MRIRVGKKTEELSPAELRLKTREYQNVLIDIGTGDGRFVYRWAAEHPATFCIGIDAAGENMREISARALRKPARGGLPNVLFVVASVEDLPDELVRMADTITINFPWGSLLKALVQPDATILSKISRLAKPGATFIALINYSVFKNQDYAERLALPALNEETISVLLKPVYKSVSLEIRNFAFLGRDVPHRTTWGQHLILGSARETLMIEGVFEDQFSSEKFASGDASGS